MIRCHEPLSEVRKRTVDYSNGKWGLIAIVEHNGLRIVGSGRTNVELGDRSFLRVFTIFRNVDSGEVRLRGMKFFSVGNFSPLIPRAEDEICWYQELLKDEKDHELDQSMVDVDLKSVVRKRNICLTNAKAGSARRTQPASVDGQTNRTSSATHYGTLTCRWKIQRIVRDDLYRRQRRVLEVAVVRVCKREADPGFAVDDGALLMEWRQGQKSTKGPYTFADIFCGAGGASAAAKQAGVLLLRSVDSDENTCVTYTLNFPGVVCQHDDVFAYVQLKGDPFVDIIHISAPCQYFSPMHTRTATTQGWMNSEANRAASFSMHAIILKDRPRIVTSENTAGLHNVHPEDMYPILGQLTSLNYSVKFAVLNMADYGIAQKRERLIFIGAW